MRGEDTVMIVVTRLAVWFGNVIQFCPTCQ